MEHYVFVIQDNAYFLAWLVEDLEIAGKCAQPCRLNYDLFENSKKIDSGYLLSTRDLLGLEYLPFLIENGVTSFKIEGRMKTPEYVATVTRIYRKYIDLVLENKKFSVDEQDKKDLLQVFNRGLSSNGHLDKDANKKLVYKEKPNNMGLPLGIVQKYNKNKGYITIKLKERLEIGDTISLENETGSYTVSELMEDTNGKLKNIPIGLPNKIVTIGRMKGNISIKDKVFKISSKKMIFESLNTINSENRKIPLKINITIKKNAPISATVTSSSNIDIYNNLKETLSLDVIPIEAKNKPLTKDDIIKQISKTGNTIYNFESIKIDLDENVFLPKLSILNELRRTILEKVENYAISNITRTTKKRFSTIKVKTLKSNKSDKKISILLNLLNSDFDYSKLKNVDNIYIPLKYFANKKYSKILDTIGSNFNLFIYLPPIIKANYNNIFYNNIENAIKLYNLKGFVLSNISNFVLLEELEKKYKNKLKLIANYTFNIFNNQTVTELFKLGISKYVISPELDKDTITSLTSSGIESELIVYGKLPLMNINYCLLGQTNKCYPKCDSKCKHIDNCYYLKDRLNMDFEIIPDNVQTVTTIYNSKILSISTDEIDCTNNLRIDILHENIDEINEIINVFKSGKRLEGKNFTNGNLKRII